MFELYLLINGMPKTSLPILEPLKNKCKHLIKQKLNFVIKLDNKKEC